MQGKSRPRALVVHPGTQHSARLAQALDRLDALSGFHTGFVAGGGGIWARLIETQRVPLGAKLSRRLAPGVSANKIELHVGLELASQALQALGYKGQAHFHWRNARFQRAVPDSAIRDADVVIGFDTSSWILAERCKAIGRPLIMVQTIGHPDAMAAVNDLICSRFPDWAETEERRLPEVRRSEQIEFDETTLIVGSSSFTRKTMVMHGVSPDKINIVPHGVDSEKFRAAPPRSNRPFRFIFVGSVTSRKGVPLLLEAWRKLASSGAELLLVGSVTAKVRALLPDLPGLRVCGHVPSSQLSNVLNQCDLLVFPSFFEGFGLVLLEAMACGLPVITTEATAGPDLIADEGLGGWLVPSGNSEALADAMAQCLRRPDEVNNAGRLARMIAEKNSWTTYGENWMPVLAKVFADKR